MTNIDEIMYLLDWKRTPDQQAQGLLMAKKVTCLKLFFQPLCSKYGKNVWENCAIVISERSDEDLLPYLVDMLLWLQDINWPGAEVILQRLLKFEYTLALAQMMKRFVLALVAIGDASWLFSLAQLLDNDQLSNKLDQEIYATLRSYNSFSE